MAANKDAPGHAGDQGGGGGGTTRHVHDPDHDHTVSGVDSQSRAGQSGAAAHSDTGYTHDSDIHGVEAYRSDLNRFTKDYGHMSVEHHGNRSQAHDKWESIFSQDWAARLEAERGHRDELRTLRHVCFSNLVDEQKRIMGQESRHHDLAVDRQWNIDEQIWATQAIIRDVLSTGVINDAVLVPLAQALAALSARVSTEGGPGEKK